MATFVRFDALNYDVEKVRKYCSEHGLKCSSVHRQSVTSDALTWVTVQFPVESKYRFAKDVPWANDVTNPALDFYVKYEIPFSKFHDKICDEIRKFIHEHEEYSDYIDFMIFETCPSQCEVDINETKLDVLRPIIVKIIEDVVIGGGGKLNKGDILIFSARSLTSLAVITLPLTHA